MSPIPKVMVQEPAIKHLRMHITRHTQFEPKSPPRNLLLDIIRNMDNMPQPIRLERQQRRQLQVVVCSRDLGEMRRDAQTMRASFRKRLAVDRDITRGGVSADVNRHETLFAMRDGKIYDLQRFGEGVMGPVDCEDQINGHLHLRGAELVDRAKDRLEVFFPGERARGRGARDGAKLQVADPVVEEVLQDGEGGVGDAVEVVAELVDGFGEDGEEALWRVGSRFRSVRA